jgi:predicted RNase H-like HicB family nuclease
MRGQIAAGLNGKCPAPASSQRGINTAPKSSSPMEARNYHVSLKRQRGERFVARWIELPGCLSEGKTETEALKNIQDAIKLYLKDVEAEAKEKKAKLVQVTV